MQTVHVGSVPIGPNQPLTIIAGPCVAESLDLCMQIGQTLQDHCAALGLGYIFKASFDKANRSSITSPRGPGIDQGLEILTQVRTKLSVPVTTDIHEPSQAQPIAQAVDLLQVPAFLCRQTDLLIAAAKTGKPVNVKKGQFMSPGEMTHVVAKLQEAGPNPPDLVNTDKPSPSGHIILTERGTFFGYQRLVNDFPGVADLMNLGYPVCFDVTHSTQLPGARTDAKASGGRPQHAPLLARCAVAAGVQSLFIETHPQPANALSDAATMLPLDQMVSLLKQLAHLHQAMAEIQ